MQLISKTILLLLAGTTAHAAIIHPLDEKRVLEVPISQGELTRIKVKDDRILQVFGLAGEYVMETDDHQGQIFIRPLEGRPVHVGEHDPRISDALVFRSSSKPINLTITTEAGHTQDLRLIPKDKPPEALILKVDTEIAQELAKEKQASAPLFREEVEELLHACREGRIPLGYKEVPLDLSTLQGPHLLVREIQGQKLRGLTYRVHNNSQDAVVLSEPELAKELPKLIALLISKKTLNPGEGTDVYVVARAN
jgi:type-F conjugative transfer system secretin TraK